MGNISHKLVILCIAKIAVSVMALCPSMVDLTKSNIISNQVGVLAEDSAGQCQ